MAKPKTDETAVAPLDDLEALAEQYAGMGTSDREEDKIQAWVKVLHQLSPEMDRNDPTYAGDNAKPGDIWIAAHGLLIPGQQGFRFQQCGYQYAWVEWSGPVGSGGRPLARHADKPAHLGESTGIGTIDMPNGHQIIETRYHLGLVYTDDDQPPFPATISYSSTGSPVSMNWVNKQWAKKNRDGSLAPTFKYLWRMVTVERKNDQGRWYLLMPKEETPAQVEQFRTGAEIAQQIKSNQLQLGDETSTKTNDEIPF